MRDFDATSRGWLTSAGDRNLQAANSIPEQALGESNKNRKPSLGTATEQRIALLLAHSPGRVEATSSYGAALYVTFKTHPLAYSPPCIASRS
jgi:hypothetical protein